MSSTRPGETTFAVTPRGPRTAARSAARSAVHDSRAALTAPYEPDPVLLAAIA
nr:hypothetical protein [Nonomuraea terrae]